MTHVAAAPPALPSPHVAVRPRTSHSPTLAPPGPNERDGAPATGIAARFRTRLCETYEATRRCPYAYRCMFAHGRGQLRTATMNLADALTSEAAVKAFQKNQQESAQRRKAQYAANHPGTPDQGARTLPGAAEQSAPMMTPMQGGGMLCGAPGPGSPRMLEITAIYASSAEELQPLPGPMNAGLVQCVGADPQPGLESAPLVESISTIGDEEDNYQADPFAASNSLVTAFGRNVGSGNRNSPQVVMPASYRQPARPVHAGAATAAYAGTPFLTPDKHGGSMPFPTPEKHGASLSYPHPRFTGSDIHHYRPELVGTPPVTDVGHSLTTYMRTPNFNASVASIRSIDRSNGAPARRGSVASVGSIEADTTGQRGGTPASAAVTHTPSVTPTVRLRRNNPYELVPLALPLPVNGSPHGTPYGSALHARSGVGMSPSFAGSAHSRGPMTPHDAAAMFSPTYTYDDRATPQSHYGLPRSIAASFRGTVGSPYHSPMHAGGGRPAYVATPSGAGPPAPQSGWARSVTSVAPLPPQPSDYMTCGWECSPCRHCGGTVG
jgi:hypothetical protein